jgi:hypothetical protein
MRLRTLLLLFLPCFSALALAAEGDAGSTPAPPTEPIEKDVALIQFGQSSRLAEEFPCKNLPPPPVHLFSPLPDAEAELKKDHFFFCIGDLKVEVQSADGLSSVVRLWDLKSGARLGVRRVLGWRGFGVAVGASYLYFWETPGPTILRLDLATPTAEPKKYSRCSCGTEGSYFVPSLVAGRALCVLSESGEEHDALKPRGALLFGDGSRWSHSPDGPLCTVAAGRWRKRGRILTLDPTGLSAVCKQLLGIEEAKSASPPDASRP